MPIKNLDDRRLYYKLKMREIRKKRDVIPNVIPNVIPDVIPDVIPALYIHDIIRYELFYDVLTLRKIMLNKSNFNVWMNKQISVLDEIHLKKNIQYL